VLTRPRDAAATKRQSLPEVNRTDKRRTPITAVSRRPFRTYLIAPAVALAAVVALVTVVAALPAWRPAALAASAGESGLPLPRFVSLRAAKVNVRTGPGVRYPIAWVYVRRGLPVEITAEFGRWRKVVDIDGAEGWIHRIMTSGERTAIVIGGIRTLYRRPEPTAMPMLHAEPGVQGRVLGCRASWCELVIEGVRGWTQAEFLWGIYPGEDVR